MTTKNDWLIIPHTLENTILLHREGIRIPHPIFYHYSWPGLFKPKRHQIVTAAYLTYWRKALCTNGLGTGKTLAAMWAAHFLMEQGYVRKIMIVCKKKAIMDVWGPTLFLHFPKLHFVVLTGSATRRRELLAQDTDVYIINHHGLPIIHQELIKRNDIDLVIYDEVAILRNCGTLYKDFRTWTTLQNINWIWPMTATPTPNLPVDAWALARVIDSPRLKCDRSEFEKLTTFAVNGEKRIPKQGAEQLAQEILFPCVRFSREQCIDMPPVTYIERRCGMSEEQKSAYDMMEERLIYQYEQGEINAVNGAVQLNKMFQISSGFIYETDTGEVFNIDTTPKLELVHELLQETEEKVLVYVPFIHATNVVSKYLTQHKITHVVIHGKIPEKEQEKRIHDFKFNPEIKCLVAQADSIAESLNFAMADVIIWFGPTLKNLIHEQANGRITREEQDRKKIVYYVAANAAEQAQYRTLRNKQNFQDTVNQLIQLRSAA